ncbi:MAG: SDR family oxidoreductase [Thermomicrobiales bacterium]
MAETRTAVVTGASSGMGAATVRMLREHGWDVVGVARRKDRLDALAEETGATTFVADVTSDEDVANLAAFLKERGPVNTLVNVAGGAIGSDYVENAPLDAWREMYETNVIGMVRVTKALLPLLREAALTKPNSDILTVSSTAGHIAYEGGGGYTAAKHGTTDIVETLRLELVGEPIRVMEIAPGMVRTPEFSLNRFGGDQAKADKVYENVQDVIDETDCARVMVAMLEMPTQINLDLVVVRPLAQAAQYKVHRGPLKPKL